MILKWWSRCSQILGGRYLFSWAFWAFIPYTGSIRPEIVQLERGFARIRMRDRRFYRNHLRSLHAIAIANLAECASGLSLVPGLPPQSQAILVRLEIEYLKKGRGTVEACASCTPPAEVSQQDFEVLSQVKNSKGELLATAKAIWKLRRKS